MKYTYNLQILRNLFRNLNIGYVRSLSRPCQTKRFKISSEGYLQSIRRMGNLASSVGLVQGNRNHENMAANGMVGDGIKGQGAGAASDVSATEIKADIQDLISQERVVIFSKESCPYCFDAKNVFDKIGQKYAVVELNQHPQGGHVQDALNEITGARTVPRVFVDGKCIGGGSDTLQMYKSGKLEEILSAVDVTTKSELSRQSNL